MMYGSGSVDGDDDGVRGSRVGSGIWCGKRTDPVLNLLSDLYSKLDAISVGVSGSSSYPTSYCLLNIFYLLP